MNTPPTPDEVNSLFTNNDPDLVWRKAVDVIRRISPAFDFTVTQIVFNDIMSLFRGEYPGFCPIKTLYHNLHHTLDVFLCAVRLMHGVKLSGKNMSDREITVVVIAALMHDVGYAQHLGEDNGTGAQHTQNHVARSIVFMQQYIAEKQLPVSLIAQITPVLLCSNPALNISDIEFPDERIQLCGKILGTADLTGQMADRTYLEKLLFLFLEFEEAGFYNYQNIHELLRNTGIFYETTQARLREQFDGIDAQLSLHFKEWYGIEANYYLESIEKNLAYLAKITSLNDAKHLSMLKRGGIVENLNLNQDLPSTPP
ncbi:MAG: HD domain-containing protein [Nitrosomonadales bacterium]